MTTINLQSTQTSMEKSCLRRMLGQPLHHHHHHLSLNCEGCCGTTNDSTTSFLHSSLFPTALWDLANSRPVHSLMSSSHLFLCLPCLLPPFTATYEGWFWPDLMTGRRDHTTTACFFLRWSGLRVVRLPAGSWHGLPRWQHGFYMRSAASCGSTFPWLSLY